MSRFHSSDYIFSSSSSSGWDNFLYNVFGYKAKPKPVPAPKLASLQAMERLQERKDALLKQQEEQKRAQEEAKKKHADALRAIDEMKKTLKQAEENAIKLQQDVEAKEAAQEDTASKLKDLDEEDRNLAGDLEEITTASPSGQSAALREKRSASGLDVEKHKMKFATIFEKTAQKPIESVQSDDVEMFVPEMQVTYVDPGLMPLH